MSPKVSRPDLPPSLCRTQVVIAVVLAGELLAALLTLAPGGEVRRWELFGVNSLAVQWIMLVSLATLCLLTRWTGLKPRLGAVLVPIGVVSIVTLLASRLIVAVVEPLDPREFTLRALLISLIVSTAVVLALREHLASRQAVERAKQSELEALQARIHPHFLFNTLNSAAALVHARPDDAERVLLDLSDLFRAALSEPGWVPLSHELALCRRYLAIEQLRFGERLQVAWDVSAEPDHLQVPLLAVQPLVENAVAHGLDDRAHGRHVRIAVSATATSLEVAVANPLPQAPTARTGGHGIGLAAVRARIEVVTAGQGRLEAGPAGTDFVARVVVPRSAMPQSPQATIS